MPPFSKHTTPSTPTTAFERVAIKSAQLHASYMSLYMFKRAAYRSEPSPKHHKHLVSPVLAHIELVCRQE